MSIKYIAFDCETTGLNDKCDLLTVSFIILDENLESIDTLNIKLRQNDGYYIYPEALKINKIDIINHHKESIDIIDARDRLLKFLEKNKSNYRLIPIGHNIQFDIKFIKKSGLLLCEEYDKYISYNVMDTLIISQFLKLSGKLNSRQNLSLISLCKSCNLVRDESLEHSAEYDIKMTIELLKYYKNLMSDDEKINKIVKKKRLC